MTDVAPESAGRTATGAEEDKESGEEKEGTDSLDIGHGANVSRSNPVGYGV
jgi:hypothetical protein